jgi:hypothetical protein
VLRHLSIIDGLEGFGGNIVCVDTATPQDEHQQSINRASTEHQQSVNRASSERQQSVNRASTERQQSVNRASTDCQQSNNTASPECQQSVNDFGCGIMDNRREPLRQIRIMSVLAAFISKCDCDMVTAPVSK